MRPVAEAMQTLRRHMCDLFWKIAGEKKDIVLDGMPGYHPKAQFVAGKVINQCSYVLTDCLMGTEREDEARAALTGIVRMVSGMPMETWGILNGIEGLWRLRQHGLLETLVDADTLDVLRASMDWRTFVDVSADYALIHKPTNYYGVAFGIARYRELLGWDEPGAARILLDHLLAHIRRYSGELGFMDETQGDGRFDRYSLLVPGELTILLLNTGWQVPELIRDMLRRSTHAFLRMANAAGTGVAYGRSIGAYGETAAIQVLAAAALCGGVMTEEETAIARGYTAALIGTMTDFWYDEDMQSINMWDKGRRTDEYRNKHRILGENLSLNMQMVDAIEQWQAAGYDLAETPAEWQQLLSRGPRGTLVQFAQGDHDRCLVLVRDGAHVWQLPVISGGKEYYDKDPYQTVPRENLVLEGVADEAACTLLPHLQLTDGATLFPSGFASTARLTETAQEVVVDIVYNCLCVKPMQAAEIATAAGSAAQQPEKALTARTDYSLETQFRFSAGCITRRDTFRAAPGAVPAERVTLRFAFFSDGAEVHGDAIRFAQGPITAFGTTGYGAPQLDALPFPARTQDTPHGPNRTAGSCVRCLVPDEAAAFSVGWRLTYRPDVAK